MDAISGAGADTEELATTNIASEFCTATIMVIGERFALIGICSHAMLTDEPGGSGVANTSA